MFRGQFSDISHDSSECVEHNLLCYCPRFIAQLSNGELPRSVELCGCLMIVDISGFTHKSSTLGSSGRSGIDELRNVTRGILASYLNVIDHYGGEVIAFAGDALICLFHSSHRLDVSAVVCAFELKDCASSGLTTHAAVVKSTLTVAILGGFDDRYSYLVGGTCLHTLGRCLDAVKSSQLVICATTFDSVKSCISGAEEVSKGLYCVHSLRYVLSARLSRPRTAPSTALSRFVPMPILSAIANNAIDDLAELRVITTLFLKLNSFPSVGDDLLALQPLFFAYQSIISDCGGMLRQFLVDDKGCVMIVLFGVPTAMHLNNSSRAVRCAMLLSEQTRMLSHVCSIGITTGKAYCGLIGSASRQEYVAMGKVVNLAARLMSNATNGLLIDAATYSCLRDNAASCFVMQEAIHMKGFDDTVVSYRLTAETALFRVLVKASNVMKFKRNVSVPGAVQAAIQEALDHCQTLVPLISEEDGSPRRPFFCIIHGPAGYGKSAAVQKYCDELCSDVVTYVRLRVHANLEKHSVAAMLVVAILKQFALLSDINALQNLLYSMILQCMGHPTKARSMTDDLLDYILDCNFRENGKSSVHQFLRSMFVPKKINGVHPLPHLDDHDVLTLLRFMAMRYQIVSFIVEGAEHLSENSWEQLYFISVSNWPVVIVLSIAEKEQRQDSEAYDSSDSFNTPRTHSMLTYSRSLSACSAEDGTNIVEDSNMARLLAHTNTTYIRLAPMSYEEVAASVKSEMAFVNSDAITHIYELSKGNHFWVALLIQYAMELGVNEFSYMISNVEHRDVLATAILSRLKDKQYHIAKVASVIGIDFHLSILRRILPRTMQVNLKMSMDELIDMGVLLMVDVETYSFQSALLRDLIYQLIPPRYLQYMLVL